MSIPLMGLVWTSTMQDATEVAVLSCLASHANDDGESCFAGIPRIAKIVRRSERTVQRTIDDLERAGWLLVQRGDGAGNLTRYEINVEQLKGCQDVTLLKKSKRVTSVQQRVTLVHEKGDIGDTLYRKETLEETKANTTSPPPPQAGGAKGEKKNHASELPEQRADAAFSEAFTAQVKSARRQLESALRITNQRTLDRLQRVVELEAETGGDPPGIALDMIAAWNEQGRLGHLLKYKLGLVKFFELGTWKRKNDWAWDEPLLRERAGASVGSFQ